MSRIILTTDVRKALRSHLRHSPTPDLRLRAPLVLVAGLADRDRAVPAGSAGRWAAVVAGWVTDKMPRTFGFFRSRWFCALLALVLGQQHQVAVGRETIRRWLH